MDKLGTKKGYALAIVLWSIAAVAHAFADWFPGLTIPIWFVADVTTEQMRAKKNNPEFQYEIACAQLCGLGHYRMRGFVTVLSAEEFQKWMDAKVKEALEAGSDPFR